MEALNINLDAVHEDELEAVERAFVALWMYVGYRRESVEHRKSGNIARAVEADNACDRVYTKLPEWAKW